MKRALAAAAWLLAAARCCAGDAEEEAGLKLADATASEKAPERGWQLSAEPALVWARERDSGATRPAQRLSLDFGFQAAVAPGWQVQGADRLDLNGPARLAGDPDAVNTLKELYASGRFGAEDIVDAGRVNARFGVASGYNPTDYFRDNALRSVTSVDPASLRENRLGTVMLRGQHLRTDGALTAIFAPRLADAPNDAGLSADVGATNQRTRWLLGWTQRWGADFAPQFLLHGNGDPASSPLLGLNLTRLLSSACVGFAEWSGGRMPSMLASARQRPDDDVAFRSQWSAGGTCSSANDISLTLEYEYNGAALDRDGWRALAAGPPQDYLAYRQQALVRQDPPTRDNVFTYLRWQNALVPRLDLAAFARFNLADHSRLGWVEARYHWGSTDLALQWQASAGSAASEYGASPLQRVWQVLLRHYF